MIDVVCTAAVLCKLRQTLNIPGLSPVNRSLVYTLVRHIVQGIVVAVCDDGGTLGLEVQSRSPPGRQKVLPSFKVGS